MGLRTRWTTAVAAVMVMGAVGAPPAHAEPVDTPPVAVPDTASAVVGTLVVVNPLLNDTDADMQPLALDPTLTLQAGTATVALVGSGPEVAITPTSLSQVVVGYTVTDVGGASASSTITVDVLPPPNQPPVAAPDAAQMYSGSQLLIDPRANDSDPDGEALTLTSATVTSGAGTVTTDGQVLTIDAVAGFVGPLVVTYVVSDPRGGQAQSTVTVDVVAAPNRPPVAVADAVTVTVGRTYRIPVLANDTDPEGGPLTLATVGRAKHGTARRSGSKVVYRAPRSWTGRTKIRYTVRDAAGATTKGALTITIQRRTPAAKPKPQPKPPASGSRPSKKAVESALLRLGLPTGSANGQYDARTRRAVCAWRTITGRTAKRSLPSAAEARAIVATQGLPVAQGSMVTGVNVSITCQAVFWVGGNREYRRVMAASTGMKGFRTRVGTHRIFVTHRVWRYSTIYPEARMYKPMQFSGGQALHGSATDSLVKTYPASHGCVRMLHRDIDALQAGGVGNGTLVRVFGAW
jgi:Bacterial Ig domain/L,D-transpeptidase catalytic domain